MNYGAEPLLDGGQFGGKGDKTGIDVDLGDITEAQYMQGLGELVKLGYNTSLIEPHGNPFGSGQGGPVVYLAKYFAHLFNNPEEQEALLRWSGTPPQDVVNL